MLKYLLIILLIPQIAFANCIKEGPGWTYYEGNPIRYILFQDHKALAIRCNRRLNQGWYYLNIRRKLCTNTFIHGYTVRGQQFSCRLNKITRW